MNKLLQILDSTLREGEQTPGVYFDRHIKLAIAKLLDDIGVDIIETGHPSVTSEIHDSVKIIAHNNFNAVIGAHARSLKDDVKLALDCGVDFIGIFYCVSDDRLTSVFKNNLDTAIHQIEEVIKYAKKVNPKIIIRYTPEDTVRSEYSNVLAAATAAVKAGADIISVADTTGYMIPGTDRNMFDYISKLKNDLSAKNLNPKIAVHCHNDRGLALANSIDAFRAGAEIIDASVLGIGERAGIVDLAQLMTLLSTEFGFNEWKLDKLTELYQFVSSHSGVPIPDNYPIIGEHAFTHCAGVHTHAAAINPTHYESLNPELFGRTRKFALDHMSGIASIKYALSIINEKELSYELQQEVLNEVKKTGQKGKIVDLSELSHIVHYIKQNFKHKKKSK